MNVENIEVTPAEIDVFDETDLATAVPPPVSVTRRKSWLGRVFLASAGVIFSLAVGLWTDGLIRDLFGRAGWLGWLAAAFAALALAALFVLTLRELFVLSRLAAVETLRRDAWEAWARDDPRAARAVVAGLVSLLSTNPQTAGGRRALGELEGEIIDGAALIGLAETELLSGLDERAKRLILDAAKRVSLVTAVSPRALVDVAYVLWESGRLIRRLSELYGGRPGTLGFFRVARGVLAHLAVTGSIAIGDSFVQQIVGHGLAARLSARLGEGVVNGMMTARIGIAALEVVRPLPFIALKKPGLGDFLAALATFATARNPPPA